MRITTLLNCGILFINGALRHVALLIVYHSIIQVRYRRNSVHFHLARLIERFCSPKTTPFSVAILVLVASF